MCLQVRNMLGRKASAAMSVVLIIYSYGSATGGGPPAPRQRGGRRGCQAAPANAAPHRSARLPDDAQRGMPACLPACLHSPL